MGHIAAVIDFASGVLDGLISGFSASGEFVSDKVTSFFKQHAPKAQNRKGESLPSSC